MKRLILVICFMFITTSAHASFYVFNENNRCVGKLNYLPDVSDLQGRNEFYVESQDSFDIMEVEYINGSIKERVKSQSEKDAKIEADEKKIETKIILDKIYYNTLDTLIKDGKTFKHYKLADFTNE